MIASNDQLYELPITGLTFQEETMDDAEHRFSYRYKRHVHIKVCILLSDNGILLSLTSNKKNQKIKKLLSTIETLLMEKIPEHPRFRMHLVTGNKPIETDIDYDVEENVYIEFFDYHYGLWGQWLSIILMIGVCFWDLTIGTWVAYIFLGCIVVYLIRNMIKWAAEIGSMYDIGERIHVSMGCLVVYMFSLITVFALATAAQYG